MATANPRMYFNIDKKLNILRPVRSVVKDLDVLFNDVRVCGENFKGYNKYTKEFIEKYKADGDIYFSDMYDWDSTNRTFNFYDIQVASDEDYTTMFSGDCSFDVMKDYKYSSTGTVTSEGTVLTLLDRIKTEFPCPPIDTGFYVEETNWNYLVRNIMKHANTMLIGPTGTGKTCIVQKICDALNIPCHIYDMGAMQDPVPDLLGSKDLVEVNGTTITKFTYARFVEDIQKPGVILLDELSRAPLMANNILFPCLDGRRKLYVDIAPEGEQRIFEVHPECTFIATANIGAEYSGTNDIDAALMNRFLPIQLDYLPQAIETQVLNIRTGLAKSMCEKIINVVTKIRAAYAEQLISKSVSTRETLACAELVADGFDLLTAINYIITNKYMNTNYNEELTTVKKLIMGY